MSRAEIDAAVAALLARMGCAETAQVRRALPEQVPLAAVNAALKRLGAMPRPMGDWPNLTSLGARMDPGPGRFTVWSLAGWKQAHS